MFKWMYPNSWMDEPTSETKGGWGRGEGGLNAETDLFAMRPKHDHFNQNLNFTACSDRKVPRPVCTPDNKKKFSLSHF